MGSSASRFERTAPLIEELRDLLREASASPGQGVAVQSAGDILARLQPHLGPCGITRVADLTDLDVIGIPVFAGYRPNSRSLAVSLGKSLEPERAKLGAVMEAMETTFSERAEDIVVAEGSRREMMADGRRPLDRSRFRRSDRGEADDDRKRDWVAGLSAVSLEEVLAPFELIGLDLREDAGWDRLTFRMTSIGLAAHSSMAGAALNALLELVENDATAPLGILGFNPPFARPLAYEEGLDGELDRAVAKVRKAGLAASFHALASRVELPVVSASIEPVGEPFGPTEARLFAGFACRSTVAQAALAALLEAVQSRLAHISGARDDLMPEQYRPRADGPRATGRPALTMGSLHRSSAAFGGLPPVAQLGGALAAVLKSGVEDVFLFPLGGIGDDLRVVRVLAPAMQAAASDGPVTLGTGAIDMLLKFAGRR